MALYANVGADLTHYDVDIAKAELIKRDTMALPASVQYAWPHASRRYLYVASSDSQAGYGRQGTEHHVTALAIDPKTGALSKHGEPIKLPLVPSDQLRKSGRVARLRLADELDVRNLSGLFLLPHFGGGGSCGRIGHERRGP